MPSIDIASPKTQMELDDVRTLFREFVAWHRRTHLEDIALIEKYFDKQAFEAELAGLPGHYGPPRGKLLLARIDGEPAGCVALHELSNDDCEMKRMFVPDRFRSNGVGQALGSAILESGRSLGYRWMRLDTSHRQHSAMRLYTRLGFKRIEPYSDLTPELRDWLVFFELRLSD